MKITTLLGQLRANGVKLSLKNGQLECKLPKNGLDSDLMSLLIERKEEIKSFIAQTNIASTLPIQASDKSSASLSFAQQRLWFLDQLNQGSAEHNLPRAYRFSGDLRLDCVTKAFTDIIAKHNVLRTVYNKNMQYVLEDVSFSPTLHDLSGLREAEQSMALKQLLAEDTLSPFALDRDLMLRVSYVVLQRDNGKVTEGVLLINIHHIATDGWSMEILMREFVAHYRASLNGYVIPTGNTLLQYIDYAQWEQEESRQNVLQSHYRFWDKQLQDLPPTHSLTLDFQRPEIKQNKGALHRSFLSEEDTCNLNAFAKRLQITPFMLLHGALSLVLSRHSNTHDIIVGTPVANRLQSELWGVVGCFANTVVLRVDTSKDTVSGFFDHIRTVHIDAMKHQAMPFDKLVERLQVQRTASYTPIFQIMLLTNNDFSGSMTQSQSSMQLPGVELELIESAAVLADFDLTINLNMTETDVEVCWRYDTSLFAAEHISQLDRHLITVLKALAQLDHTMLDSEYPLHDVDVIDKKEQERLIVEFNEGSNLNPQPKCIHEVVEGIAKEYPQQNAVVYENEVVTYDELNRRANQLARYINTQYPGPKSQLIGVYMPRSIDMMVAILAVMKAGHGYLPLDPDYPSARLKYMCNDAQLPLVLSCSSQKDNFIKMHKDVCMVDLLQIDSFDTGNLLQTEVMREPNDLAYCIYTSGSTGNPKGILVEHATLTPHILSIGQKYALTPQDRVLQFTKIGFDISIEQIFTTLCFGATLVIMRHSIQGKEAILQALENQCVSVVNLPPQYAQEILCTPELAERLTQLRLVILGGEALSYDFVSFWRQKGFFDKIQLLNAYGPAETTITTTLFDCSTPLLTKQVPIGHCFGIGNLFVLDSHQRPVPLGVTGELFIGGPRLSRGYLNKPELTETQFVDNPFYNQGDPDSSVKLYKTGDLVRYLPDGNLLFVGRKDDQIKLRGFRIELSEIEAQLKLNEHVESTIVMARGQGQEMQLVAYVVADKVEDKPNFTALLKAQLHVTLPDFMVPSHVMCLDAWPLSPNGKINKHKLPAPELTNYQIAYCAPEGEMEKTIVAIWSQLLNIEEAKISRHDNFFEIGGQSLLCVRMINLIQEKINVDVSIRTIFENPQLHLLASAISKSHGRGSVERVPRHDLEGPYLPVSFSQQRLWFIDKLHGESSEYHIPVVLETFGPLNKELLKRVIGKIIDRHEVLRTCYVEQGGEVFQLIKAVDDYCLSINQYDLRHLNDIALKTEIDLLLSDELVARFDLANDIPIRVSYIEKTEDTGVLIFNMHHIASDGWSMEVLYKEFCLIYSALYNEQEPVLTEMEIQYADYASWQRGRLSETFLDQQMTYWQSHLADAPLVHSLPTKQSRPEIKQNIGQTYSKTLDSKTAGHFVALAKQWQVTPFMLAHALLCLVISRHSNSQDVVIGTPVVNRLNKQLEPLIGLFTNTLALRAKTNFDTVADYLAHIKQVNLDAQSHQDIPFEMLLEHLNIPRNTSYGALFQIMLTMEQSYGVVEESSINTMSLPGLQVEPFNSTFKPAKFDLELGIQLHAEGMGIHWTYDVSLFEHSYIEQFNTHFCQLLESLIEFKSESLNQLQMLSGQELAKLAHCSQGTHRNSASSNSIYQLFEQQVELSPQSVALVYQDEELSYEELNARSNQLARLLQSEYGIGENALIALCAERSLEMVIAILAIWKAGGAYVPIDPNAPLSRMKFILEDTQSQCLLSTCRAFFDDGLDIKNLLSLDDLLSAQHPCAAYDSVDLDKPILGELAYVIYTSGSTGQPKGVLTEHSALSSFNDGFTEQLGILRTPKISSWLWLSPFIFDASLIGLCQMAMGATLVIPDNEEVLSSVQLIELIKKHNITALKATPQHLALLTQNAKLPAVDLLSGGEKIGGATLKQLQAFVRQHDTKLLNAYGPTETTINSCFADLTNTDAEAIGTPMMNTSIQVVGKDGNLVPFGCVGELYIGGDGLAQGYLNNADLTHKQFISCLFNGDTSQRFYKTGDLVRYLPDDQLQFVGREDQQVKVRGFRVELEEIAETLEQHKWVEAAVVTLSDNGQQIIGYLKLSSDNHAEELSKMGAEFSEFLSGRLPEYMIPAFFYSVENWKLGATGKIDKSKLLDATRLHSEVEFKAPTTESQRHVAEVWSELLEIDVNSLSIYANFFALGGTSLHIVKITHLLNEKLNTQLSVLQFMQKQTLQEQACLLEEEMLISSAQSLNQDESDEIWEI